MAIPVLHKITAEADSKLNVNTDVYQRGVGEPPKYHVWCTCQWEGWTHDKHVAINFMMSHRHSQIVRGNVVELYMPAEWGYSSIEVSAGVAEPAGAEPEKIVMSAKPETPFSPNGNPNNVDVTKHMQPLYSPTGKVEPALTSEQKVLAEKEQISGR